VSIATQRIPDEKKEFKDLDILVALLITFQELRQEIIALGFTFKRMVKSLKLDI
jgi:hypothetical protein